MSTAEETRDPGHPIGRILLRLFLIGCGLALFVVAGIVGAMATLKWLV